MKLRGTYFEQKRSSENNRKDIMDGSKKFKKGEGKKTYIGFLKRNIAKYFFEDEEK